MDEYDKRMLILKNTDMLAEKFRQKKLTKDNIQEVMVSVISEINKSIEARVNEDNEFFAEKLENSLKELENEFDFLNVDIELNSILVKMRMRMKVLMAYIKILLACL